MTSASKSHSIPATPSSKSPPIASNPSLQSYYSTLESRVGYWLLLGNTRHFGYYEPGTWWPFPLTRALQAMEEQLYLSLSLPAGASVLDAGCGAGRVAIYLAKRGGLNVQGIDVVERHVELAQRYIAAQAPNIAHQVNVRKGDFHHLEGFDDQSFDGVYTMETLVHATDPRQVLSEFFRVLKPGGMIAEFEYEHLPFSAMSDASRTALTMMNVNASMPAYQSFEEGTIQSLLEEVGFVDVVVKDLSKNCLPMLRLFAILAFLPYLIVKLFGLERTFTNTVAGFECYWYNGFGRYVSVKAKRPKSQ